MRKRICIGLMALNFLTSLASGGPASARAADGGAAEVANFAAR